MIRILSLLAYKDIAVEEQNPPNEKISHQVIKVSFSVIQPQVFLTYNDIVCEALELSHEKISRQV